MHSIENKRRKMSAPDSRLQTPDSYVPLYCKSNHSFLEGASHPEELVEARIYSGMEGLRLGLVDAIGSDTEAIKSAASLAGVSHYSLVDVNVKVLRESVKKSRRIFEQVPTEESTGGLTSIDDLRRFFPSSGESERPGGVPPGFPVAVTLPQFYYLYVAPSE